MDKIIVGNVCEWGLSSGVLIEHKVHDGVVYRIALSGDRIVTDSGGLIRVFDISTCLLVLPYLSYSL